MQNNTKTAVMILQELTVFRGLPSPEYNIMQVTLGPQEFEFRATVCVEIPNGETIIAKGKGQNKKAAKHNSAHNALNILESKGVSPQNCEMSSPTKVLVNCIGKLREICSENKLPEPDFILVSDIGPPHSRQFTYQCKLGSFLTQATEGSKKQAKQVAAEKMFERITDILPELVEEYNSKKIKLEDEVDTDTVTKKYIELTPNNVKYNYSVAVNEMDKELVKLIKSKGFDLNDFKEYLDVPSKENVNNILEKLELTTNIVQIQENPFIVGIEVNVDFPLAVINMGQNLEDTTTKAYLKLFETINYFLN